MEQKSQPMSKDYRQNIPAGSGVVEVTPSAVKNIPHMGNRKLLGKMPVRYVDTVILVMAVVLIGLFVYFIVNR